MALPGFEGTCRATEKEKVTAQSEAMAGVAGLGLIQTGALSGSWTVVLLRSNARKLGCAMW